VALEAFGAEITSGYFRAMTSHPFGIYIHIPFCRKKCGYCAFSSEVLREEVPKAFIRALCSEILEFQGPDESSSIFLGGGTPSLLGEKDLECIFGSLYERFHFQAPEITIEVNPDDVTPEKADAWKALGINRVSLGVQSFDDDTLRFLDRRHDALSAKKAARIIADRFSNWNMDLIYGIPLKNTWADTLRTVKSFSPPHLSTYALTYVENTPMGDSRCARLEDDTVLQIYQYAELSLADYDHYEISNFAAEGFYCRHNLLYWHNEPHAGFGPAAYSFVNGVRAVNVTNVGQYVIKPGCKAEETRLSRVEEEVETLIQHFRLREGIHEDYFPRRFGESLDLRFGEVVNTMLERGLLEYHQGYLRPTPQGFYLNDEIGLALVG